MNTTRKMATPQTTPQAGFGMVEVLVSLVILMVGLLGLAGLMVQSQRSEMESYQRVQALVLLKDMYGRINANRGVASCYALTTTLGTGTPNLGTGSGAIPACASGTPQQSNQVAADLRAWDALLKGSAESANGGITQVGAMTGARGCISYNAGTEVKDRNGVGILGTGIYTIAVAWQGLGDTFAPPAPAAPVGGTPPPAMNCGIGQYGNAARRRIANLTFRISLLTNP